MGGRDHSCEECGAGGFNNDEECTCYTHRLVRIANNRCQEFDHYTFVLAPIDWTAEEIQDKVDVAEKAYLTEVENARKLAEEKAPPTAYSPPYKQYPNKTVAEIDKIWEEQKQKRREYDVRASKTRRSFSNFLTDQGFKSVYGDVGIVTAEAYWGHRHGWGFLGEETKMDTVPTPAKAGGFKSDPEFL